MASIVESRKNRKLVLDAFGVFLACEDPTLNFVNGDSIGWHSDSIMVAADIPVHREIYAGATAIYFDSCSAGSLVELMKALLAHDANPCLTSMHIERASSVPARCTPEALEPKWEVFLDRVVQREFFFDGWDDERCAVCCSAFQLRPFLWNRCFD